MESAEILPTFFFKKNVRHFTFGGQGGPVVDGIQNLRWQGDIYNNLRLTRTAGGHMLKAVGKFTQRGRH